MADCIVNTSSGQPELPLAQPLRASHLHDAFALPASIVGWSTWQYVATFLLGVVVYDQVMYIRRKGSIAGPPFKIPLMGPFLQALYPKFDEYLVQWARGPLSCVSIFHKFVVLASDRDIAHKVFKSPSYAEPCIVPVAKDILGHKAWVFLQGKAHAEYRRGLTPLFTNKALATYLPVQQKVLDVYFDKFVAASKANQGRPMAFMALFRELNCAFSCRTFFGDYLSQDAVKKIADDFYLVTTALELVSVPLSLYIPFTKQWWGKRTADAVHVEFARCAAACKANMAAGAKPTCIVDHWVLHMMESERYRERIAAGEANVERPSNMIREFTNEEIGETLFTFLFASQDASSSATTWLFQVLAQRPDVLDRLREENLAARGGDRSKPFDLPMLESLTYTAAVVKELLRHRPPVIFVPYLATKDFALTPNYTVPRGSLVVPSCYPALHDPDVYPHPDVFDPERWISGDAESKTKNWLVFGAGPHDCLARRYVPLSLTGIIGKAALELDWKHHATERSEEIRVFASLFPMEQPPQQSPGRTSLVTSANASPLLLPPSKPRSWPTAVQSPSTSRRKHLRHGAGPASLGGDARAPTAAPRHQQPGDRHRDARRGRRAGNGPARLRDAQGPAAVQLPDEQAGRVDVGPRQHPRPHGQVFPPDRNGQGDVRAARAVLPTSVHHLLSLREGPHLSPIPRRTRPPTIPLGRRALHRLQALRSDLPRPGHHHRGRGARRRLPPNDPLRHRHDEVHLLRLLPGVVPRRRHRREPQRRVRHGDEGGAAVQQGEAPVQRRQVGARARGRHPRRFTLQVKSKPDDDDDGDTTKACPHPQILIELFPMYHVHVGRRRSGAWELI